MSKFEEISIPVPWGHIAGKAWNSPRGRPVLLAHGIMDNAGAFDRLVALLPASLYLVALDLPGHGRSSPIYPSLTLKYTDIVMAIEFVRRHLEWDKFTYIGHSAGAYVGFWYGVLFPDRLTALIALDEPIPVFTKETGPENLYQSFELLRESERLARSPVQTFTHAAAIQRILALHPDGLTVGVAHILAERTLEKHTDGLWKFRHDHRAITPQINPMTAEQAAVYMGRIRCAVLQVAASDSVEHGLQQVLGRSYAAAEPIRRVLQDNLGDKYRFCVVEGKHCVHMDYPERLSQIVADFLAEHTS